MYTCMFNLFHFFSSYSVLEKAKTRISIGLGLLLAIVAMGTMYFVVPHKEKPDPLSDVAAAATIAAGAAVVKRHKDKSKEEKKRSWRRKK